jgi:hypothetical protein
MGSLKSGLFAIALVSLVGTAAVVGCSASGGTGITEADPTEPDPGNTLPPTNNDVDNDVPDTGRPTPKKDAGPKVDSGVDSGPPPPVEGAACPVLDAKATKPCGACGKAETLCLDDGTGKGKWTAYGACDGELAGGCTPGTIINEPCGNCGTQKKTCTQFCAFTTSFCSGQPANSCKPGALEYSGAGCPSPSTYRNRTCGAACTWGGFSATCETPVNEHVLNIGAAVGAVTSKTVTFTAARMASRLSAFSSCPLVSAPSAGNYPYQYIEIKNPSATKAAKVTIYSSAAPGGAVVDTILAAYATAIQPMNDAQRQACRDGVNDQSSSDVALTGDANFSILKAVAIPAGGSILVYLASYYQEPTVDEITTGDLNINTKIETLQ